MNMQSYSHTLLTELGNIVGPSWVISDEDLSRWEQDWNQRARGKAFAVVLPASTDELASVVKFCAQAGMPIVPQGGNTGLVLGATPDDSGGQVIVSTSRMKRILEIDVENMTASVQAGCVLQELQEAVQNAGLLFPLSLGAQGSCTIGGNLATNAGGTQVIRYGNMRELCLGVECVLANGEIWNGMRALRKDNTGYNLTQLLIGSEGTLGIITAATLKLFPLPSVQHTAWAALSDLDKALDLLQLAHRHLGPSLTGFEVMGREAVRLVVKHMPSLPVPFAPACEDAWHAMIDCSAYGSASGSGAVFEHFLEQAVEKEYINDVVVATNEQQRAQLWHIRESIPMAQAQEGLNIKHDISVPVSSIPKFVETAHDAIARAVPGARFVTFGHLGDGNLHYNVQAPEGEDAISFRHTFEKQVNQIVYQAIQQFDGSFSAEHGIGSLKAEQLLKTKSDTEVAIMRSIKDALDPLGILNPGKVILPG